MMWQDLQLFCRFAQNQIMNKLFFAALFILCCYHSDAKFYGKLYTGATNLGGLFWINGGQIGYRYKHHITYLGGHYSTNNKQVGSGVYGGRYYPDGYTQLKTSGSVNIGYAYRFFYNNSIQIQPFIQCMGDINVYQRIDNNVPLNSNSASYFTLGSAINVRLYKSLMLSLHGSLSPQQTNTTKYLIRSIERSESKRTSVCFGIGISL